MANRNFKRTLVTEERHEQIRQYAESKGIRIWAVVDEALKEYFEK